MAEAGVRAQMCVTSPPYWGLRDYGTGAWEGGDEGCKHLAPPGGGHGEKSLIGKGARDIEIMSSHHYRDFCRKCGARRVDAQMGLEETPEEYVATMVEVFRGVREVLADDGTVWLNLGDSYSGGGGYSPGAPSNETSKSGQRAERTTQYKGRDPAPGLKPKDLVGIPWRVAFALQADGWILRSDIIWSKSNPMPESVTDRPTKAHEYLFLLSKRPRYYYDNDAVREPQSQSTIERFGNGGADRKSGKAYHVARHEALSHELLAGRNRRTVWTIASQAFSGWSDSIVIVQLSASQAMEHAGEDNGSCGDIARITSLDCPLHAALSDHVPRGFCDGLSDAQVNRIHGTRAHPVQDNSSGCATTRPTPDLDSSRPSKMDSSDPSGFVIATESNKETRRMARALATSGHGKPSSRTDDCTERSLRSEESVATSRSIGENRTVDGSSGVCAEPEMARDSVRMSGWEEPSCVGPNNCQCAYYRKVVNKTSHFATFPEKLVEPCVLAGTSAHGHCPECGARWLRVTQKERDNRPSYKTVGVGPKAFECREDGNRLHKVIAEDGTGGSLAISKTTTTGWSPSCACNLDAIPDIVLDPFLGSGTTAQVAQRLGRRWIGIDLNSNYTPMQARRTSQSAFFLQPMAVAP